MAARRAVVADAAAEQAAYIAGSDDLSLDAEQVEPDLVESDVEADADADANERVGIDRHVLPARFVAGSRHADTTTSPLLRPTGVSGTGPINAGADGAASIEEYRALQIKLKTALAEKHHLSQHSTALLTKVMFFCQCSLQLDLQGSVLHNTCKQRVDQQLVA